MGSVQWVSDATGQTVFWVPFVQAHYRRGCFDSFPNGLSIKRWRAAQEKAQPKYLRTILTPTSLAAHFSPLNLTAPSLSRLARCSPSFSAGNPFSLCPGYTSPSAFATSFALFGVSQILTI